MSAETGIHVQQEPPVNADSPNAESPTAAAPAARRSHRRPLRALLEAYALVGLTIATAAFFALYPPTADTFLTAANLQVMISGDAVTAIVAFGMLIPLVCYEFDLSVGASATVASVFAAAALAAGTAIVPALALGIGCGLVIGTINALLITRAQIDAVITTLGITLIMAGVVSMKTHGIAITGNIPAAITDFGTGTLLGIPLPGLAWAAVAIVMFYVLEYTPFGRYLYTLGGNRTAAKLVGIRVQLVLGSAFVIAGVLGAVGGILQVAVAGSADPNLGNTVLLPAFAAAFLSVAAIRPGRFNAGGTVVAVLFLAVLNSGLNLAGVAPYTHDFVNGIALITGVALAMRLGGRKLL